MKRTRNESGKITPIRVFLVGCPRSGTTLLQSLLACHSQILSFPESHFYRVAVGKRSRWHKFWGLASPKTLSQLSHFLKEINREDLLTMVDRLKPWQKNLDGYSNSFIDILDMLCEERKKRVWIEKTPDHLLYAEQIQNMVPGSKFIHIVREGKDVVASLYEVTQKYPDIWRGTWDLDKCIFHWKRAVALSCDLVTRYSNHTLVYYEELTKRTGSELEAICRIIGIDFDDGMVKLDRNIVSGLVERNEHWKSNVSGEVRESSSDKFYSVLTQEQQQYVLEQIASVDLSALSGGTMRITVNGYKAY